MKKRSDRGDRPLKIDVHTHILPAEIPDFGAEFGYDGFIMMEPSDKPGHQRMMQSGRFFREVHCNCWDSAVRMDECDAADVDVQVLSTVPVMFCYWARPADAAKVARFLNDDIAATVAKNPTRFVGLGTLPMQDADLAIAELRRCMNELGFAGVQIGSHVNSWNLDAPELFPIFEEAERLGAAVFVHPWDMPKERMERFWMPWLVGMPTETTVAIMSLMFGGVMRRLPKLRLCFAHGGGSFPGTIGRIEHGHRCRPDLVATVEKDGPREFLGKFWLDSLVHDSAALTHVLSLIGPDKCCLGSDYPFPLGEVPRAGRLIETMLADGALDAATVEKLFHGAALDWLGLTKDRFLAPPGSPTRKKSRSDAAGAPTEATEP